MKRKSLIAAVMVLVLLCASSVCVALATNPSCDHDDCSYRYEVRFSTESEVKCSNGDESCTVTQTHTMYDIWCPKCLGDVAYGEEWTWEHTGEQCNPKTENEYHEYWD